MTLDFGRLTAVVTENLNLKLLSLTFALALYSLVHGSQEAQRSLLVSVVALTPPQSSNRELVTPIPPEIRVTVRGARQTLDDIHPDDIQIQIDLRRGIEERLIFSPTMIPVPPGIRVEQIDPPEIALKWEDRIVRDLPVEVGITGTPAKGLVVKGVPSGSPTSVAARGPKSEVSVLQRVRTDAFDVTGLAEGTYTRQLAIERPPAGVTYDVPSVSGTIEISREVVERPFTKVPVVVLGRPNAKAQPTDVDVRLSCPPEVVRALRPEQLLPRVQVSSPLDHGADAFPVLLSIDPCTVHVTPSSVVVRW